MPRNISCKGKTDRDLVDEAFQFVKSRGLATDTYCIEATVNMHNYLTKCGVDARLIRYETPDGGHWTIETPAGEFDPTISSWDDAPADSVPGELYEVTSKSPHKKWKVDSNVNVKAAYSAAWIEDT